MKQTLRLLALLLALACAWTGCAAADSLTVTVDWADEGKPISPLIYGVNQNGDGAWLRTMTVGAFRQGGNRWTG